jgi:putative hydrolase of the HAD superfamily
MMIKTIAFDADDTLWENEHFFKVTEAAFTNLLARHAPEGRVADRLFATEMKNLEIYGFGIKGFLLSMIETAVEATDNRASGETIAEILQIGREMLRHPVTFLPGADDAIRSLQGQYRLLLITKGDIFDQERKIALSGLSDCFDAIEIVADKKMQTYQRIFRRHDADPARTMMVGNSLKSDIIPVLDAGGWATYVPHPLTWGAEFEREPVGRARYARIAALADLAGLLEGKTSMIVDSG